MAKKSTVKKTAAKKTAAKQSEPKKKATPKKSTAKKSTAKKSAAKGKGAAEKTPEAAPFNLPASAAEVRYSDGELAMLREKQLELAMDGDRQMLIWLGRSVLGQAPAPVRAGRAGEEENAVIVLTPEEAAALYGSQAGEADQARRKVTRAGGARCGEVLS